MSKKDRKGFEKKLARELGTLAILIQLEKQLDKRKLLEFELRNENDVKKKEKLEKTINDTPEGIHTYDLLKKVENTVFSRKNKFSGIIELIGKIIKAYSTDPTSDKELSVQKKELQEEINSNFLIKYNSQVQALLNSSKQGKTEKPLKDLQDLENTLKKEIDKISNESSIWNSISGIYPVMNQLEEKGLIEVIEVPTTGRLKKIYGITPLGREHLQKSFSMIRELTNFFKPPIEVITKPQPMSTPRGLSYLRQISPLSKIGRILFRELDLSNVNIEDLSDQRESVGLLLRTFLGPRSMMFSEFRPVPFLVRQITTLTGTDEKSKLLKIMIKKRLEEARESIDQAISMIDDA